MINDQREEDDHLKQEAGNYEKAKASSSSSSTLISSSLASQWTRLKDPRIVRVSRAFGGKDRHSKVCTIRGLRDRRVRLSVPTAIQLYDLQDRLGLNQPSKVVDWLLNVAKNEIDELPPLPNFPTCPIGNFPFSSTYHHQLFNDTTNNQQLLEGSSSSQQNSIWKVKPREVDQVEVSREMVNDKANFYWMNNNNTNKEGPISNIDQVHDHDHPSAPHNINLLQKPSFFGNYQWESNGFITSQSSEQINVIRPLPLPSTLSLSTGNSQLQLGATNPSHDVTTMEMDERQINHQYHQMLSSNSQTNSLNNPSFSLAMMSPKFHHYNKSQSNNQDQE